MQRPANASRREPPRALAALNAQIEESGGLADHASVHAEYVWLSDPDEPFEPGILMNRCQLLGLLSCRHAGLQEARRPSSPVPCGDARMSLVTKDPLAFSLRELRDTIDNILIEWPRFAQRLGDNPRSSENLRAVHRLIGSCFARLGQLATCPGPASVFDDASCTEPHSGDLIRLSRPGLRRLLGSFLALFRHLELVSASTSASEHLARRHPGRARSECAIRKHHVEASTDDFHALCMHMLLPVAAKLNYRQDFPGMYNHVSQVIYFHNSQYERTQRAELQEMLSRGDPMQALPAICQIHPEIEMIYEEDRIKGAAGKWRWLVVPRRVYLLDPSANAYYSENIWELLEVYKAEC